MKKNHVSLHTGGRKAALLPSLLWFDWKGAPFLQGVILVGMEVLVRIEEHFDETKHRKDPNTLLGASYVYVRWVCQRVGYVIVHWRVLPGGLALDFRQGLAAFSTRLRAPKLYSTGGFAQAESIRLHRNCHEFWLKYGRNPWGKKTTILSNTFNRMFALILLRLTATLTILT